MASPFQQQSLRRKIVYTVLILVLFSATLVFRQMNTYGMEEQARNLGLREETLGDVELAGSALRLSLGGARGIAVCGLWWTATQKQMKQQWNELELIVRSVTKLQPHFITPWLFQSWNLSYNVSVESDRIRDKYFYIAEGILLLAEGERQNKDNPDLRYSMGFYTQHKIGLSDEANTFRCLFDMSRIDPVDRDPARLRTRDAAGNETVDLDKFEQFCRKHPTLVRRLREVLKKNTPADILDFLEDHQKIPSRFEEKRTASDSRGDRSELKSLDQQFPVWPPRDPKGQRRVSDPDQIALSYFFAVDPCIAIGRFEEAREVAEAHDEVTNTLSPHHRLHAVSALITIERAAGRWEAARAPVRAHNDNFVMRGAKCCLAAHVTGVSTP